MVRDVCKLLSLILGVASIPAVAAEGRIPIPFAAPVATPITISNPGRYVLTRNLAATAAGPIFEIIPGAAVPGDIEIDLNGFILNNTLNPGFPVIRVSAGGAATREVVIRNGALQGGSRSIEVMGGPGILTRKLVIEDIRSTSATTDGIYLDSIADFRVSRCTVVDAGDAGIRVENLAAPLTFQGTIEGNIVRNCQDGIDVNGGPPLGTVAILNNRVESVVPGGPYLAGIQVQSCLASLVSENTIREVSVVGGVCLRLVNTNGSKLFDNVISRCSGHGIQLDASSNDNYVVRNVVREASGAANAGLRIDGDRNHIEANLSSNNTGHGFEFIAGADNNVYRQNVARGNLGAACAPVACSPNFCNAGVGNASNLDNFIPGGAGCN